MTDLSGRGALGLKADATPQDPKYLEAVCGLCCAGCGVFPPVEAHHCRDMPDHDEQGLYVRLPGARRKSHDYDAIPLCVRCHWLFHNRRAEFHANYGRDYTYIGPTRARLTHPEDGR